MRRTDREVTDPAAIREIIGECRVCRLGFFDGREVYVLPLHFGAVHGDSGTVLYFHGAKEGRKADLVRNGCEAGFEMDADYLLKPGDTPCSHSARFKSVIGTGFAEPVTDPGERVLGLRAVMRQSTGRDWEITREMADAVLVFKLTVGKLSCKIHT